MGFINQIRVSFGSFLEVYGRLGIFQNLLEVEENQNLPEHNVAENRDHMSVRKQSVCAAHLAHLACAVALLWTPSVTGHVAVGTVGTHGDSQDTAASSDGGPSRATRPDCTAHRSRHS